MLLGQGKNFKEASCALEISEQTYYRWRKEHGGLDTTQAKKLKELEKENARLKWLVVVMEERSMLFGIYWRINPFMFSFVPFSQAA